MKRAPCLLLCFFLLCMPAFAAISSPTVGDNSEVIEPLTVDTDRPPDHQSLDLRAASLTASSDGPALAPYVRYLKNYSGDIRQDNLAKYDSSLMHLDTSSINFGRPDGPLLVLLSVKNEGSESGEWLFTTGRGALKSFQMVEYASGDTEVLLDGSDMEQVRNTLQTYHSFTHEFNLDPGEQKQFAITFEGKHSTILPLKISTKENFFQKRFQNIALVSGSVLGMLTLMVVGVVLYTVTGKPEFLWLGLAEIFHAVYVLHIGGYTTFYFLYDKGPWVHTVGFALACAFSIAMAQFARSFLNTRKTFPALNIFLIGLIITGAITIVGHILLTYHEDSTIQSIFGILTRLVNAIIVLLLPYIAAIATLRLGRQYWPLLISWSSLALFSTYGAVTALGLVKGLSFNWHLAGPFGLFGALFISLSMGLHLRNIYKEKLETERGLNESLQKQIEISENARRLEQEKASALATIHDQGHLIHASGHDSQQVLLALNSIVEFTDKSDAGDIPKELSKILRASASQLEDIISTTMAGPISGVESSKLIALSRFKLSDLLRPLEMIYRPLINKKNLSFRVEEYADHWIISDRALLARVLSNILSNSLKFTYEGSITLSISASEGMIQFTISDTGPGIEAPVIEGLSAGEERRIKTDDDAAGTGFGLLASQKIMSQLHGKMEIDSKVAMGTTVIIRLPFIPSSACTKLEISDIQSRLKNYVVVDTDVLEKSEIDKISKNGCASDGNYLPVTYDPSARMRGFASAFSDIVLLKPVCADMLCHPAINQSDDRRETRDL